MDRTSYTTVGSDEGRKRKTCLSDDRKDLHGELVYTIEDGRARLHDGPPSDKGAS